MRGAPPRRGRQAGSGRVWAWARGGAPDGAGAGGRSPRRRNPRAPAGVLAGLAGEAHQAVQHPQGDPEDGAADGLAQDGQPAGAERQPEETGTDQGQVQQPRGEPGDEGELQPAHPGAAPQSRLRHRGVEHRPQQLRHHQQRQQRPQALRPPGDAQPRGQHRGGEDGVQGKRLPPPLQGFQQGSLRRRESQQGQQGQQPGHGQPGHGAGPQAGQRAPPRAKGARRAARRCPGVRRATHPAREAFQEEHRPPQEQRGDHEAHREDPRVEGLQEGRPPHHPYRDDHRKVHGGGHRQGRQELPVRDAEDAAGQGGHDAQPRHQAPHDHGQGPVLGDHPLHLRQAGLVEVQDSPVAVEQGPPRPASRPVQHRGPDQGGRLHDQEHAEQRHLAPRRPVRRHQHGHVRRHREGHAPLLHQDAQEQQQGVVLSQPGEEAGPEGRRRSALGNPGSNHRPPPFAIVRVYRLPPCGAPVVAPAGGRTPAPPGPAWVRPLPS